MVRWFSSKWKIFQINTKSNSINLAGLSNGIYFVKILTEKGY
ncbi:MAG TPA: hypothetical protein DEG69_05095 [Flavobacteriaceae bacterium]|nr:hypothetical protein [Flavobacteriaceae bacterium]